MQIDKTMRLTMRNRKVTILVGLGLLLMLMVVFKTDYIRPKCLFNDEKSQMIRDEKFVEDSEHKNFVYHRNMPLIFIGGVPRSGTTLMRAMLDAHPEVRCGQETRVIPRILQLRSHWMKSEKESMRLQEAGISKEVLNSAIAQFCLEIIARHGDPAPRLCNKDPLTLKMGSYVIELFPQAKFLFMVRDGRATVHSIITRKVTITGFDLSSYRQCMTKWNQAISTMHDQCRDIGKERCMMVYYEQLVLHPEEWMRKILKFLDIPWNESVLHHEQFINKQNGVALSKVERSSDQVIKPVNLEALSKWVGQIPDDVVHDMADIAPMLSVLGYDPYSNPPDYGKPDSWVQENTYKLKANKKLWETKAKRILDGEDVDPPEDNDSKNLNAVGNDDDGEEAAAAAAAADNNLDEDDKDQSKKRRKPRSDTHNHNEDDDTKRRHNEQT